MRNDINIEKNMNRSLHFVADNIVKSGHNSKPVLFHSFKVGMILYQNNYSEDIILAGILHDLIEDTDVTKEIIKEEFNEQIAKIVSAVSFDPTIKDKYVQAKKMFLNCKALGKEALIVKCADLLDNINYIKFSPDKKENLLKKYLLFLEIAKSIIGKEQIFNSLKEKYSGLL